jgi:hypothetical protein
LHNPPDAGKQGIRHRVCSGKTHPERRNAGGSFEGEHIQAFLDHAGSDNDRDVLGDAIGERNILRRGQAVLRNETQLGRRIPIPRRRRHHLLRRHSICPDQGVRAIGKLRIDAEGEMPGSRHVCAEHAERSRR